jgi:hypothetical protein
MVIKTGLEMVSIKKLICLIVHDIDFLTLELAIVDFAPTVLHCSRWSAVTLAVLQNTDRYSAVHGVQ